MNDRCSLAAVQRGGLSRFGGTSMQPDEAHFPLCNALYEIGRGFVIRGTLLVYCGYEHRPAVICPSIDGFPGRFLIESSVVTTSPPRCEEGRNTF